jgi:hypothetical protein
MATINEKLQKKLNANGVLVNKEENVNLIMNDELLDALNGTKAYKYAFGVEKITENISVFCLESKKKIRDANGDKIGRAKIFFPLENLVEFFNKFNLDGEGFIEDKLVFYKVYDEEGAPLYYLIPEEVLDEVIDAEESNETSSTDEDDDEEDDDSFFRRQPSFDEEDDD